MARQKREDLERELTDVRERLTLADLALTAVFSGEPDALERATLETGYRVELRAYRLCGAHGGIVVRVDRITGQQPDVNAYYLDALSASFRDDHSERSLPIRRMIGTLEAARRIGKVPTP